MKLLFKIFLPLILITLPLSIFAKDQNHSSFAKDQNHSSIAKEKGITIEQYQEAENTIGNPDSELYDETAFAVILEKALAENFLDEAERMRAEYRIEMAAKNKPGSYAADFRFELRPANLNHSGTDSDDNSDNDALNLYDVSTTKPILLMFYDPDCGHCMETIGELSVSPLQDKVTIIAIDAEEDREGWLETLGNIPESWTVGFALDPIQEDETYIFVTSPSIYLLSPDKKVLLKDTRLNRIEEYLSTH